MTRLVDRRLASGWWVVGSVALFTGAVLDPSAARGARSDEPPAASTAASTPAAPSPATPDITTALRQIGVVESDNAALFYFRAWLLAGDEARNKFNEAATGTAKEAPSDELKRRVIELTEVRNAAVYASTKPTADWGVQYSKGFGALLPELGLTRFTARLLRADAAMRLHEPKPDVRGAGRSAVACVRLARHVAAQRILISSLVSAAIVQLAADLTAEMIEMKLLDPVTRDELLAEFKSFREADGMGFNASIKVERLGSVWFRDIINQGASPFRAAKIMGALSGSSQLSALDSLTFADKALVLQSLDQHDACMQLIINAWSKPDAEQQLQQIEADAAKGLHGVMAKVILPSLSKSKVTETKVLARLDEVLAQLKAYTPPENLPIDNRKPDPLADFGVP